MKVVFLTAGAAGMYCGSCMHDNALARALRSLGVDCLLQPTYTPIRTDEVSVADERLFFGGIQIYLLQNWTWLRHVPSRARRLLDWPPLVRFVSRRAGATDAAMLGDLAISMLRGTHGNQREEVLRLVDWLENEIKPDAIVLSNLLIGGLLPTLSQRLPQTRIAVMLQGDDIFLEHLPERQRAEAIELCSELQSHVDVFVTNSRFYAAKMGSLLGIESERIRVVPLSIDVGPFDESVAPGRAAKAWTPTGSIDVRPFDEPVGADSPDSNDLHTSPSHREGRTQGTSLREGDTRPSITTGRVGPPRVSSPRLASRLSRREDEVTRNGLLGGEGAKLRECDEAGTTSKTTFRLGYLARIAPEKGLHRLVDAFIHLAAVDENHDLTLEVAGWLGKANRPYFDSLCQRIADARLIDRFTYHGSPDLQGKVRFLKSLDLLCVPTEYEEPKGLFVLEALAAGVCVAQPDHGAFGELLEQTGGGLTFSPDSTEDICRVLQLLKNDAELRLRLASDGQRRVLSHHTIEVAAQKLKELLGRG